PAPAQFPIFARRTKPTRAASTEVSFGPFRLLPTQFLLLEGETSRCPLEVALWKSSQCCLKVQVLFKMCGTHSHRWRHKRLLSHSRSPSLGAQSRSRSC